MQISESLLEEYYRELEPLDLDEEMTIFGEDLAQSQGGFGAAPLRPQQYIGIAGAWFREHGRDICRILHENPQFARFLNPSTGMFLAEEVSLLAAYIIEVHFGSAKLTDPVTVITVGKACVMAFKHGFKLFEESYGKS